MQIERERYTALGISVEYRTVGAIECGSGNVLLLCVFVLAERAPPLRRDI